MNWLLRLAMFCSLFAVVLSVTMLVTVWRHLCPTADAAEQLPSFSSVDLQAADTLKEP